MAFTSYLSSKMVVIDDSNFTKFVTDPVINGEKKSRGHRQRDYRLQPLAGMPSLTRLPFPTIPRAEWPARIEELERTKSRLTDICDLAGLKVKDQNGTNYCWINAPVHCAEILRVRQGLPLITLSPASVGCKIKNFRNVGGWGTEGLEYIVKHGIVPSSLWPDNAQKKQYDTAAAWERAKDFIITEWYDLVPRSFDELATCLLLKIPVAVGYNWWGHEVTAMDLVMPSKNKFGIIIHNSWGPDWSDNGRGVLLESKATPDDAVAPRAILSVAA